VREQHFEVRGVAASGEASDFRLVAGARAQQRALRRLMAPRPSEQQVGRERVKQDRARRPGGKDALDLVRNDDRPAGRISEVCGAGNARCNCYDCQSAQYRTAIDIHAGTPDRLVTSLLKRDFNRRLP
jgi:hypothetical protein